MEVQAGEGEIDNFISEKESKNKEIEDKFEELGVATFEKAQSINREYERLRREIEYAERNFAEELGENEYEKLEQKYKQLGKEKEKERSRRAN